MKVKDLIGYLEQFDKELEVYLRTDHGQSPTRSCQPAIAYYENIEGLREDFWTGDIDEAEEEGYSENTVLLVQG